jgi:DNA-binding transcriptional ArsR family regulator
MAIHSPSLPRTFAALADPTRFAVVERLAAGPARVSDLAAPFAMAGPSFLKHLRVLEGAGLVTSRKSGRVRTVALAPDRLREVQDWLQRHRQAWDARLDRLAAELDREE